MRSPRRPIFVATLLALAASFAFGNPPDETGFVITNRRGTRIVARSLTPSCDREAKSTSSFGSRGRHVPIAGAKRLMLDVDRGFTVMLPADFLKSVATEWRAENGRKGWKVAVVLLDGTTLRGHIRNQAPLHADLGDRTVAIAVDEIERIDRVDPVASLAAARCAEPPSTPGRHEAEIPAGAERRDKKLRVANATFLPGFPCPNGCPIDDRVSDQVRCNEGRILHWDDVDRARNFTSSHPFSDPDWPVEILTKDGETVGARTGGVPGIFGTGRLGEFRFVLIEDFRKLGSEADFR